MRATRASAPAALFLFLAFAVGAQAASIEGKLFDPDGQPLPRLDVELTFTNTATGKEYKTLMTPESTYALKDVPAGTYDVNVPIPSRLYARFSQRGIAVKDGETLRFDIPVGWGMNLGTIADDPLKLGADLRARTKNVDGPVPRTHDGKPDLSGIWTNIGDSVSTPRIPYKPWAQEMWDQWRQIKQDNPGAYCLPLNGTLTLINYPYKFVQTPKLMVQLAEGVPDGWRQIFLDGRPHPDPNEWNPSWYGHSVGHWEGDTLVVETVGFNEITPGWGIHSEKLKVVERYRRISYGRMEIEITAEDPEAWTAPVTRKLTAGLAEDAELMEYICAENNQSHANRAGPWRGRP